MSEVLEITKTEGKGFIIMRLKGRLESVTSATLTKAVEEWSLGAHGHLLFDCNELKYVSSAGLRIFLTCNKQGKTDGWMFALFGVQSMVVDVLRISGFNQILKIFPDEASAIAAFAT